MDSCSTLDNYPPEVPSFYRGHKVLTLGLYFYIQKKVKVGVLHPVQQSGHTRAGPQHFPHSCTNNIPSDQHKASVGFDVWYLQKLAKFNLYQSIIN